MSGRVLVGCEESGVFSSAFRRAGFECYSCDLLPTRGDANWHIQGDVIDAIKSRSWDLIVLHPVCTALSLSGNRWYGKGMPRHDERLAAIDWTVNLWNLAKEHSDHVALENPASVIFQYLDAPVCYVQPYEHGHGEQKRTGFALHNLPPLTPSNLVAGREQLIWKMAPGPNRKRDRSKTFEGIAEAGVAQWGIHCER